MGLLCIKLQTKRGGGGGGGGGDGLCVLGGKTEVAEFVSMPQLRS